MNKTIIPLLFLAITFGSYAQSNQEIGNIYIKRAQKSYDNLEIENSLNNFAKAMKNIDSISTPSMAKLGTLIHFELNNYREAKGYAKKYFALVKKKSTEEYALLLDLYVTITEEIETLEAEEKRLELLRLQEENYSRKIDSLKIIWKNKSNELSLQIDTIYAFHKNNVAIYKHKGNFGIISDKGFIIEEANTYKAAKSFDSYILLLDKEKNSTKIYCYNTNTKGGFLLPNIAKISPVSSFYNYVTLPRANGKLILYPNNSLHLIEYDLNTKSILKMKNEKELFSKLKKRDNISKYNKEKQVKINKEWFYFGGNIGGGVYALYNTDYTIYGYLSSVSGTLLKASNHPYLGAFYNNSLQVSKGGNTYWINQRGNKISAPKDESEKYLGTSKIVRLTNGNYQILENNIIILGDKKLEDQTTFIENNINK